MQGQRVPARSRRTGPPTGDEPARGRRRTANDLLFLFRRPPFEITSGAVRGAPLLGLKILLVAGIDVQAGLHLEGNIDAGIAQLAHLVRIPRQEPELGYLQSSQNLRGKRVRPRILLVTEPHVRLEGIESRILQFVCPQFLIQTDPSALLPQVDEDSPLERQAGQRFLQLLSTVTTQRAKNVPGDAFGVNPDQRVLRLAVSRRENQRKVILVVPARETVKGN